jgi:hypothetical protein
MPGGSDVWILNLQEGTDERLTFAPTTNESGQMFTSGDSRVVFGGPLPLSWKAADGRGVVEKLIPDDETSRRFPSAVSAD